MPAGKQRKRNTSPNGSNEHPAGRIQQHQQFNSAIDPDNQSEPSNKTPDTLGQADHAHPNADQRPLTPDGSTNDEGGD